MPEPAPDPRRAAAAIVERALATRRPLDGLLAPVEAGLEPRDRSLLRQLVFGTVRWLRRLDAVLAAVSSRPLSKIDPALMAPLRVGAYQLLFLDRVPAYAAVREAVEEARRRSHRGGAGFANAVLRRVAAAPRLAAWPVEHPDPVVRLAIDSSLPDLLARRWVERFGPEAARLLAEASNRAKPLQLLAFRDRGGREALAAALAAEGVATEPAELAPLALTVRGGDPLASAAFGRGDLYLQDDASQAAALVPPPAPGERIFDAAAAPGGKSFSLLAAEPTVRPVLGDASAARLATLAANRRRLRRRLLLLAADARRPALAGGFDRVVADLPCSGTGTLRRHPELKWRYGDRELARLADEGLAVLEGVAPLVRPGGRLVAITCSLEREENEIVAERFLAARPGFVLEPVAAALPETLRRGGGEAGLWRVLTAGDHDGFTVQVLRRRR